MSTKRKPNYVLSGLKIMGFITVILGISGLVSASWMDYSTQNAIDNSKIPTIGVSEIKMVYALSWICFGLGALFLIPSNWRNLIYYDKNNFD